ncbi:cytochrome P450, partial [Rhizoctonia solani]
MLLSTLYFISGVLVLLVLRWYRQRRLVPLPGPPPTSYVTGHFKNMFGLNGFEFQENVLKVYGPTVRMTGVMGEQFILSFDPALIHTVLIKERSKFERNKGGALMVRSLFGGGLAGLRGEEHRQQRKLLNPVFTGQHLQEYVAKQTCNAIDKSLSTGVIDIIPWTTAAALELIGEAGLGYSFSSFNGEKNEYSTAIKSVGQLLSKLVPFIPIYPYFVRLPVTRKALSYVRIPLLRQVLKATSLQNEQAEQILRTRQDMLTKGTDLESVTGRGKDILTQLMKANQEGMDRDAMVGHMNILIFAGHETTSSMIARILDILSNNLEIQEKLRGEVLECGEDNVLDLSYLDAVVKEALRLYPPASYLGRMCEEDTVVPLSYPISTASGVITSLPIKKGTRLALSIIFSNRDEKVWGKRAGEFWPERWLESEQLGDPEIMIAQLLRSFKFEPSGEDYAWEITGVSNPYLSKERGETTRLPKLPLKVSRL